MVTAPGTDMPKPPPGSLLTRGPFSATCPHNVFGCAQVMPAGAETLITGGGKAPEAGSISTVPVTVVSVTDAVFSESIELP